jgi:hypothetical protein
MVFAEDSLSILAVRLFLFLMVGGFYNEKPPGVIGWNE